MSVDFTGSGTTLSSLITWVRGTKIPCCHGTCMAYKMLLVSCYYRWFVTTVKYVSIHYSDGRDFIPLWHRHMFCVIRFGSCRTIIGFFVVHDFVCYEFLAFLQVPFPGYLFYQDVLCTRVLSTRYVGGLWILTVTLILWNLEFFLVQFL